MTQRVEMHIRRALTAQPNIEVRYTDAIQSDSYHQGDSLLYVHPTHQAFVDQLRDVL